MGEGVGRYRGNSQQNCPSQPRPSSSEKNEGWTSKHEWGLRQMETPRPGDDVKTCWELCGGKFEQQPGRAVGMGVFGRPGLWCGAIGSRGTLMTHLSWEKWDGDVWKV